MSNRRILEAERAWRQKANSIRASANMTARTNSPNVNLVSEDNMFVSREQYDAEVIAQYLASQDHGNEEGPSRN